MKKKKSWQRHIVRIDKLTQEKMNQADRYDKMLARFDAVMRRYYKRFGEHFPTMCLSEENAIEMMEAALKAGKPHHISDEGLPPGAVVSPDPG